MSDLLDPSWQQHIASSAAHWAEMAKESIAQAAYEHARPSAVFKPKLSIDGDQWCALYGDNLQDGVAGFGPSPSDAMWDFDRAWTTKLTPVKSRTLDEMMGRKDWPAFVEPTKAQP